MYNLDSALVTKLLETEDVTSLLSQGLTPAYFQDDAARDVYRWIIRRYEKHGQVPSAGLLANRYPHFKLVDTDDTFSAVVELVRDRKLYVELQRLLKKVVGEAQDDPRLGLETLQEEVHKLSSRFSDGNSEDITKSGELVKRYYRLLQKTKGLLGTPWPWGAMNEATRGIRKGTFSVLYGPPGTLKTWLLIVIGDFVHREYGGRPMLVTYEMPIEDVRFRWACYRARVSYKDVQSGSLRPRDEKRFYAAVTEFADDPPFIVERLANIGPAATTELRGKIKQHEASVVLWDGLQFASKSAKWEDFGMATREMKLVALDTTVPVVASHHSNRSKQQSGKGKKEAHNADDVALGETLHRDCDNLFRLWQRQDTLGELGITSRKVREGLPVSFVIHAQLAQDFSQKAVLNDESERTLEGKGNDDE